LSRRSQQSDDEMSDADSQAHSKRGASSTRTASRARTLSVVSVSSTDGANTTDADDSDGEPTPSKKRLLRENRALRATIANKDATIANHVAEIASITAKLEAVLATVARLEAVEAAMAELTRRFAIVEAEKRGEQIAHNPSSIAHPRTTPIPAGTVSTTGSGGGASKDVSIVESSQGQLAHNTGDVTNTPSGAASSDATWAAIATRNMPSQLTPAEMAALERLRKEAGKVSKLLLLKKQKTLAHSLLASYTTIAVRGFTCRDFQTVRALIGASNPTLNAKIESIAHHGRTTVVFFCREDIRKDLGAVLSRYNVAGEAQFEILPTFDESRPRDPHASEALKTLVRERTARTHAQAILYFVFQWLRGNQYMPINAERAAMHWHHCIFRLKLADEVDKEIRKTLSIAKRYSQQKEELLKHVQIARKRAADAGADGNGANGANTIAAAQGTVKFTPKQNSVVVRKSKPVSTVPSTAVRVAREDNGAETDGSPATGDAANGNVADDASGTAPAPVQSANASADTTAEAEEAAPADADVEMEDARPVTDEQTAAPASSSAAPADTDIGMTDAADNDTNTINNTTCSASGNADAAPAP
jgi:hypothetical protein